MADERFEWLDADAAERLLRGDRVEPAGDHARIDAQRLAAALNEARPVPAAGGELPGEAAALAAFREASGGGFSQGEAALRTVRIGATPVAESRRPRWSRPLRYGLVASLAGCALGGVAVAAGTGMLPGAFGWHGSPAPAASVSAAPSPKELGSSLPPGTDPSVSSPPSPGTSGSAAPSHSPGASPGGTGTGGDGPRGHEDGRDAQNGAPDGAGDPDSSRDGTDGAGLPDGTQDGDVNSGELYEKSVEACRAHREGRLDAESERRLIRMAKGERNLDQFCDRLLDRAGQNGGDTGDGDERDGDGAGPGEGEDDGAPLPSVSFEAEPRATSVNGVGVSPAEVAGTDARSAASEQAALSSSLR